MTVETGRTPDVWSRLRKWYRDRFGVTQAEASLERTRRMVAEVHGDLASTARIVRQARLRIGRKDWPERYAERLRDRVDS